MKNTDLVSIIINNYNYETYVGAAIQSAIQQTYQNCEVIVVDDGSTDDSISVIESFGSQIKTILKPNGGQASAFNTGIEAASGSHIILLDADDLLASNAVEVCLAEMHAEAVRLCYRLEKIGSDDSSLGVKPLGHSQRFLGSMRDALVDGKFFPGMVTSGNFFRAQELKQCVPIPVEDYRISADLYIICENAKLGRIQTIPDVLGKYRIHDNNYYASSVGRFGMPINRLKNHLDNVLNRRALLLSYADGLPDPEGVQRFAMPMYALSSVSDAKLRGVEDVRLEYWTTHRVLSHLPSAIRPYREKCVKLRTLMVALTIVSNELLPFKSGLFIYKSIEFLCKKLRH